jgi:hypothetical protein
MQPGAAGQKWAALSEQEKRMSTCIIVVPCYNNTKK